jgi:hypothetical protein
MEHLVFLGFLHFPCPANAPLQHAFYLPRLRKGYEPIASEQFESNSDWLDADNCDEQAIELPVLVGCL